MVSLKNLSAYTKAGVLLIFFGFLSLAVEDLVWDESIRATLYLIPIGFFICSFIAFSIAAKNTSTS
jgi:hypothetical protein